MFTVKRNNIALFALAILSLFALSAQAQEKPKDEIKEFLGDSEFGLQRKIIKGGALGQKGLLTNEVETTDISDIITVDLIDPFANKTVSGTKTKLDPLDDGIDFTDEDITAENLSTFREKIEKYFSDIENQDDVDAVNLLNHLKIDRIISSPLKYIVIRGKKYEETDVIKVRVNRFADPQKFDDMLAGMSLGNEASSEEKEILEEIKAEALERYNSLNDATGASVTLNVINVIVNQISKQQVSFIIDDKEYKLVMKN